MPRPYGSDPALASNEGRGRLRTCARDGREFLTQPAVAAVAVAGLGARRRAGPAGARGRWRPAPSAGRWGDSVCTPRGSAGLPLSAGWLSGVGAAEPATSEGSTGSSSLRTRSGRFSALSWAPGSAGWPGGGVRCTRGVEDGCRGGRGARHHEGRRVAPSAARAPGPRSRAGTRSSPLWCRQPVGRLEATDELRGSEVVPGLLLEPLLVPPRTAPSEDEQGEHGERRAEPLTGPTRPRRLPHGRSLNSSFLFRGRTGSRRPASPGEAGAGGSRRRSQARHCDPSAGLRLVRREGRVRRDDDVLPCRIRVGSAQHLDRHGLPVTPHLDGR